MQSQSTGSPCAPMTHALARRKTDEDKVTGLPAADKIQTIMMQLRTKKCQWLPVNSQKRPKARQDFPSSSRIKSSLKTYYILLSSPALATMRHCSALFQRQVISEALKFHMPKPIPTHKTCFIITFFIYSSFIYLVTCLLPFPHPPLLPANPTYSPSPPDPLFLYFS